MNEDQPAPVRASAFVDMAPLVRGLSAFIDRHPLARTVQLDIPDLESFSRSTGFTSRRAGTPEVILAEDTAVELGHPSVGSMVFPLLTAEPGLVRHARLTCIGAGLDGSRTLPLAQVVMLEVDPADPPDPFQVDNLQFLLHRLPGYMVRSLPGKLWVRVSRAGLARGLSVETVAQALVLAYTNEFPSLRAIEILWVTSSKGDLDALRPIEAEAAILAGKHKKLVLTEGGEVECPDLDCERCEDRPVCDAMKDLVVRRRRRC